MKMLASINCEPYGYIKNEHDELGHIILFNEVADIKQITEHIESIEVDK